jgi:hypothetical protein
MNRIELNRIVDTLVVEPCQDTVLIDNIQLSDNVLEVELIHSDEGITIETETLEITSNGIIIETETLEITSNGTITSNGSFITVADLLELPQPVRNVIAMFVVAMRDGEVQGDHPELEFIANNKQFFLDNEEAFVPAGVLCAAGLVDEHNMALD